MREEPKMLPAPVLTEFSFPLSNGGTARLRVICPMREADFQIIIDTLSLWKNTISVKSPSIPWDEVIQAAGEELP
jgi:hypothetical protein